MRTTVKDIDAPLEGTSLPRVLSADSTRSRHEKTAARMPVGIGQLLP